MTFGLWIKNWPIASRLPMKYFNLMLRHILETAAVRCIMLTTGEVIGIINKVFVQGTKENAITDPSGITYAIPVRHVKKTAGRL